MKENKKILGRIIGITIITLLAAGFYLYLGRNNKSVNAVISPPAEIKETNEAKNKIPDAVNNDGTIDLVRPPFLDE